MCVRASVWWCACMRVVCVRVRTCVHVLCVCVCVCVWALRSIKGWAVSSQRSWAVTSGHERSDVVRSRQERSWAVMSGRVRPGHERSEAVRRGHEQSAAVARSWAVMTQARQPQTQTLAGILPASFGIVAHQFWSVCSPGNPGSPEERKAGKSGSQEACPPAFLFRFWIVSKPKIRKDPPPWPETNMFFLFFCLLIVSKQKSERTPTLAWNESVLFVFVWIRKQKCFATNSQKDPPTHPLRPDSKKTIKNAHNMSSQNNIKNAHNV